MGFYRDQINHAGDPVYEPQQELRRKREEARQAAKDAAQEAGETPKGFAATEQPGPPEPSIGTDLVTDVQARKMQESAESKRKFAEENELHPGERMPDETGKNINANADGTFTKEQLEAQAPSQNDEPSGGDNLDHPGADGFNENLPEEFSPETGAPNNADSDGTTADEDAGAEADTKPSRRRNNK